MSNLEQLFINCLSTDTNLRHSSEQQITELKKHPDFIFSLSHLFNHQDIRISKMSSVFFKNFTISEWDKPEFNSQKTKIMSNIVEFLRNSDKSIQLDLIEIIAHYLDTEKMDDWNQLMTNGTTLLKNLNDTKSIKAGLMFWTCVLKSEKIHFSKDRIKLYFNPLGNDIFNILRYAIMTQQYEIAKTVAKMYTILQDPYYNVEFLEDINYFCNLYKIFTESLSIQNNNNGNNGNNNGNNLQGPNMQNNNNLQGNNGNNALQMPDEKFLYKYKKWVVKFFNKTMTRCFKNVDKKSEVTVFFLEENNFSYLYSTILEILKREANVESENQEEKDSFLKSICSFLTVILNDGGSHSDIIKKAINFIIFHFIFPLHMFTDENEEMFNDSPKEYLQCRYGYYANDLRGYAGILFCNLIKKIKNDKQMFWAILNELMGIMNLYTTSPSKENASKKYSALFLVSYIAKRIKNNVNEFLATHVLPDLFSHFGFLRSQACFAFQFFDGNDIPQEIVFPAFDGVIANIKSESVVIKTDAALALQFFIENQWVQDKIKGMVPVIVQTLLELQKDNELDALNDLLENVVMTYPNEIGIYAPQLTVFLTEMIKPNLGSLNENKIMLYSGFLRTMDTLVVTLDEKPEIVHKMYCIVAETIFLIFRNRVDDLYSETIELLSQIMFATKKVDESMWDIFMTLMSLEKEDKFNVSYELTHLLDNYISFGQDRIINYIKPINDFIESIVRSEDNTYFNDEEHVQGCMIMQSLMLNLNTMVISQIPFYIDMCINHYEEFDRDSSTIIYYLEIIMHSFVLDFDTTWSKLLSINFLKVFFDDLYEMRNRFTRVMDKKLVLIFISSLLKSSNPVLKNVDIMRVKSVLISNLQSIPDAIAKRKAMMDEKYEEKEDEEVYDDLEEDVGYHCPLDNFKIYEYMRITFNTLGGYGINVLNSCVPKEKAIIMKTLNMNRDE